MNTSSSAPRPQWNQRHNRFRSSRMLRRGNHFHFSAQFQQPVRPRNSAPCPLRHMHENDLGTPSLATFLPLASRQRLGNRTGSQTFRTYRPHTRLGCQSSTVTEPSSIGASLAEQSWRLLPTAQRRARSRNCRYFRCRLENSASLQGSALAFARRIDSHLGEHSNTVLADDSRSILGQYGQTTA